MASITDPRLRNDNGTETPLPHPPDNTAEQPRKAETLTHELGKLNKNEVDFSNLQARFG